MTVLVLGVTDFVVLIPGLVLLAVVAIMVAGQSRRRP